MRILLTVHQFFPDHASGTEVLTLSVARELQKRGHLVVVLTGNPASKRLVDEARFDEYDCQGIRVFRFHHAYQPMGQQDAVTELEYNNRLAASYCARILQDVKPDVVHFFHLSRLGASLVDVVIEGRIPAFYTPTDFWAVCPLSQLLLTDGRLCSGPSVAGGNCVKHLAELTKEGRVSRLMGWLPTPLVDIIGAVAKVGLGSVHPLGREVAAMAGRRQFIVSRLNSLEAIFSPTQFMTEILVRHGVNARRIRQSAYGIDTSRYQAKPRRGRGIARTFGFIGTLSPHKGCHVLIQAFKRLNVPGARLRIYGNVDQFPHYVTRLRHLAGGVGAIEFRGTFPEDRIADVLDECDALVVPSLWYENTPLVVYSALAAQCPVVGSDFPGISEVVRQNENGLLFSAGDVDDLYGKLELLTSNPGLLDRLQAGCKPPKSISEYVDELEGAYVRASSVRTDLPRPNDTQSIKPLGNPYSYLAGWAAVGARAPLYRRVFRRLTGRAGTRFTTPASLAMVVNGVCVSETKQFSVRHDIREGFLAHGSRVASLKFGFVLRLPDAFERSAGTLEIRYPDGRMASTPLPDVPIGSSVQVGEEAFVGVEEERRLGGTRG